jgi:deoxyadenosine/deoxycytidine kinase
MDGDGIVWVCIVGIDGTGKSAVADYLIQRKKFEKCKYYEMELDYENKPFAVLVNMISRINKDRMARDLGDEENCVTINSSWSYEWVDVEAMLSRDEFAKKYYNDIKSALQPMKDDLEAPDLFVYLTSSNNNIHNLNSLKNRPMVTDEFLNDQRQRYEKFAMSVRSSLVKINMDDGLDQALIHMDGFIAENRATIGSGNTLWKRRVF